MFPLQKVAFKLDISASSGSNPESAGEFGMMQDIPFRSVKASYMSLMSDYAPNIWVFYRSKALFETFYAIWRDLSMS